MKRIFFAVLFMMGLGAQIALAQPSPSKDKPDRPEDQKESAPKPPQLPAIRDQGEPGTEQEPRQAASEKRRAGIPPLREQEEEPRGVSGISGSSPETPATPRVRPYKVSELEGRRIRSSKGENLGDIVDMIVDRDGRVEFVLVSYGGFLGIGSKLVAVPYHELKQGPEKGVFVVSFDKKTMDRAPSFESDQWPDFYDESWRKGVRSYYGD